MRYLEMFYNSTRHNKQLAKWFGLLLFTTLILLFVTGVAWADNTAGNQGLGEIAGNVQGSLKGFASLMITIAYVAGIGFVLAAIFKFKQHKDNPTQIPLGTPLALLVIGFVLVFLPSIFEPAGKTLFKNENATAGGFNGEGLETIPGAKGNNK